MPRRSVADLPQEYRPWDVPSHRRVARPLLAGPQPLPVLVRAATDAGIIRENAYRVASRLRRVGALRPTEHVQGRSVGLASGEHDRLRAALAAERKEYIAGQDGPSTRGGDGLAALASVGMLQHGNVVLDVHVEPDLLGKFAIALEHVARADRSLWGTLTHGREGDYLLVADARHGDVAAITLQLEACGARCTRVQISAPMNADALMAHAKSLLEADEWESPHGEIE